MLYKHPIKHQHFFFAHTAFPLINETFIKQALNTKKPQAISFNLYMENHAPQI